MRRISLLLVAGGALALAPNAGYGQDTPRPAPLASLWPIPLLTDPVPRAAAPDDPGPIVADLLGWRWAMSPVLQFPDLPAAAGPSIFTMQGSTNRANYQQVVKLGFSTAPPPAQQTPAFNVEASVTSRDDSRQRGHNVQNVAVSAQTALPQALHGWYVKVTGRAATGAAAQVAASLGWAHALASGARIAYSFGMTQRQARPLKHAGSYLVDWTLQWKWSERLSADLRFDYDPEMNGIDTLLSLHVLSRVPR